MSWWDWIEAFWIGLWYSFWPIMIAGVFGLYFLVRDIIRWYKNKHIYRLRRF